MPRLTLLKNAAVMCCAAMLTASLAHAGVVANFPLGDASGNLAGTIGEKAVATTAGLGAAGNYAQPGPAAGKYGTIDLSPEQAAAIKSAHFDGKTKLNLGPAKDSPLNRTGDFTLTAWVKFDNTDGYHMFLATGAGGGNGWKFGANEGSLDFTANGVADVSADSYPLAAGKWMFLAVTVKGTAGERKIEIYVNGKKANDETLTTESIETSDAAQMHLGGADNGSDTDENFVGNIAQLRVYDAVLTPDQIKEAATAAK